MAIVFLTRYFWPHAGGVEKHVLEVSRELLKLGYKITVITLKHDKKLKNEQSYQGIKIIRLPYSDSKWGIWQEVWNKRQLLKQADIVHCHDVFFWYLPFRLLWPTKKVFTTFHGWEGVWPIPKKNILAHRLAEKLSWGSLCIGEYLKKWYGHRTELITYGASSNLTHDRGMKMMRGRPREVIFVGRLDPANAIDEYLKALKIIKKNFNLPVTFVGDGPRRRQAEAIGRVTGMVDNLAPYFRRPVYVFAASYLTMWEALSYGRPVFALYHNPLKKDYLECFPAAGAINLTGSAGELVEQLNRPKLAKVSLPGWKEVAQLYLRLWQKR